MIRIPALQTALMGLIGLRPHYNPEVPPYAPDLLNSRSGIYLNDVHPLIAPENLIAALPKVAPEQYPNYRGGPFKRGAVVFNGDMYIAIKDGEDVYPEDTAFWLPTDYLSAKLRQLLDAAAAQVLNAIIQQKKLEGAVGVIEETQLYHGAGNINNRIIKEGRFCGFEIVAKPGRDIALRISRLGLQADTANPNLRLYLYHSSQAAPVKVIEPNFAGSGTFAWAEAEDVYLTLNSAAYGPGGAFYLGYYEDDVAGQIIDRPKDWTNAIVAGVGCGTCDPETTQDFQSWSRYLEFHPFIAPAALLNEERSLWDIERQRYTYGTNWGLNLTIALECDLTQYLARHEGLLADAISKQAAVNILSIYANTTEDNALAEQLRQAALYQLDNRENYTLGLKAELEKALKTLALSVTDTDSPCLPKQEPKARISHGVI